MRYFSFFIYPRLIKMVMMMRMIIFTVVATIIIIYKNILPKEGCSFIRGLYFFYQEILRVTTREGFR